MESLERRASGEGPRRIVAIGNFDGVHRGHQAVLESAARDAAERGIVASVLTFTPHPLVVLGRMLPPQLSVLSRKLELIRRVAPAIEPIVQRFDIAFAAQAPAEFAEQMLARRLNAAVVVVGDNFRFGSGRSGGFDDLTRLGERLGFETRSQPLVTDAHGTVSSTRIREAIARGELDLAAGMLGRPHMISGVVVAGDRRGRTIGFPTCNLADVEEALPPFGVYAVLVDREDREGNAAALAKGVANIGVRPTVKDAYARPTVEVNLFDVDEDLYGTRLRVHLVARLREEKRFAGLDALKAQIALDAAEARERLADLGPDPAAGGAFR